MPRAVAVKVAVTTLAFAALLGALWQLASPADATYLMVDELVRDGFPRWLDHDLKIHGWVVAGSVRASPSHYSFVLQRDGQQLRVVADLPRPPLVADQAELVVSGRLRPDPTPFAEHPFSLSASSVNTRCARNTHAARAPVPDFQ